MRRVSCSTSEVPAHSGYQYPFTPGGRAERAASGTLLLRGLMLASIGSMALACGARSLASDFDDDIQVTGGAGGFGSTGGGGRGGAPRGGSAGSAPAIGGSASVGNGGRASTGGSSGSGVGIGGSAMSGSGGSGVGPRTRTLPGSCRYPEALGNGFERCETGQLHRESLGGACSFSVPRDSAFDAGDIAELEQAAIDRGLSFDEVAALLPCISDSDCNVIPYGYCTRSATANVGPLTECRYGCTTDQECGGGAVCLCGDPVGTCVTALCTSDDDCAGALRCTAYDWAPGCAVGGLSLIFTCQTRDDECSSDLECDASTPNCTSGGDRRMCMALECPLLGSLD